MITVVIYTKDDADCIESCLRSLTGQESSCEHELVVLDDCSSDVTPALVRERFPQVRVASAGKPAGWVGALRASCDTFKGDNVAFLGAHCTALPGWLDAVQEVMGEGLRVAVGMGYHGPGKLLNRFEALTMHGPYLSCEPGRVDGIWDDNFAISKSLLAQALPDTDTILSDGAGAYLMSRKLAGMGIEIHYRPSMKVDHTTHNLGQIARSWYGEMAENAVAMRKADPTLPGAGLLRFGPVAGALLSGGRLVQTVANMHRFRRALSIPIYEVWVHSFILACLMPAYFAGLVRQMINR